MNVKYKFNENEVQANYVGSIESHVFHILEYLLTHPNTTLAVKFIQTFKTLSSKQYFFAFFWQI